MKYQQLSGREFPRYSGIKTFFRMPNVAADADYDVALVGVPFDGGVSYRPGPRFAPSKVRDLSSLGRGFHWGRGYNIFNKKNFADVGDCPTVPVDLNQTYAKIEKYFSDLMGHHKKFIAVGGDHSVTLPILRAVRKKLGRPVVLIHFDAHLDTYPAAWGIEYHHGAFARHAVEESLIIPEKSWQFGLRGPLAGEDDLEFSRKHKMHSTTVDDIRIGGLENFLKTIPDFGTDPCYITFDVDCLDPAFAPGTGTPVPGGLTTYETQRILRTLKIRNLVGCDIVEMSPPFDQSDITALACVDAMFEMMCIYAAV